VYSPWLKPIGHHGFRLLAHSVSAAALYTVLGAMTTAAIAGSAHSHDEAKSTMRTPFSEIKWKELPGGRALANVKGDFTTGPHIKLIKFGAGNKTIPHIHSHSYVGIVVKGTARHYEPGKPETQTILPAGSVWKISANVPHISECLPGSECIFATQSDGAFDVKPAK